MSRVAALQLQMLERGAVTMRRSGSVSGREAIRVELFGAVVAIERDVIVELRDAAAARAGVSSGYRDLSLVLDRALTTGTLTVRRHELRLVLRLAAAGPPPLHALARKLERAAAERDAG
jgi:hypothetical protein